MKHLATCSDRGNYPTCVFLESHINEIGRVERRRKQIRSERCASCTCCLAGYWLVRRESRSPLRDNSEQEWSKVCQLVPQVNCNNYESPAWQLINWPALLSAGCPVPISYFVNAFRRWTIHTISWIKATLMTWILNCATSTKQLATLSSPPEITQLRAKLSVSSTDRASVI